jgi:hypothetical protein
VLCGALVLTGCAAPSDADGEVGVPGPPAAATAQLPGAAPVVVDTDLGADDLVALAFLLRHPAVDVRAVTVAATGLVGCDAGVRVLAGLLDALQEPPVPVACGRATPGPDGRAFPAEWRAAAEAGSGVRPVPGPVDDRPAGALVAELARTVDGLTLVALGPLSTVADVAAAFPAEYARLAGVLAMAGSVDGPLVDGVAEWNAAADPEALAAVLAGPAPLTVVPEDAVPAGAPQALAGPVVGTVAAAADLPRWWDLATAALLVAPDAGRVETAGWTADDAGRLRPAGAGTVRVVRSIDGTTLDAAYAEAFG